MTNFLPFAIPDIGKDEIDEVVDTMKNGWLTTGPKTKKFESNFASFIGGGEAVAVNSATAGLHLALEAIGIGPGDEVITTAYTFTATAEVVRYLGADPVFVDITPATMNIDPSLIEKAVTSKTKAIIPVHFTGLSCDMNAIINIAKKYGLKVIEDAAHALPATYGGKLIGSLESDATVYSFYVTKTITTGEGGMIITRNKDIARRCKTMRLHGIDKDVFARYTSDRPSWYYEVVAPGYKYNMTDIAASIGIHQLKRAYDFQKKRESIAKFYSENLFGLPLILPATANAGDCHAWHLYVVRLADSAAIERDSFIKEMFSNGIGCSVHFIPLHLHPYWRMKYKLLPEDFPEATQAFQKSISLPIFSKMTIEDCGKVVQTITSILKK